MPMKPYNVMRFTGLILFVALCVFFLPVAPAAGAARNLIVMIADGCSTEQYAFARWFKGDPLSFDPYCVGLVKTHVADSVVADSAPAASAFASGIRTVTRAIGVHPGPRPPGAPAAPAKESYPTPMATVLEGARLTKRSTGIVSTSSVTHATPAAYYAHVPSRRMQNDIMEQAVYQGVDVIFGGGMKLLLPRSRKGARTDEEDLAEALKEKGYRVISTRREMAAHRQGRVFGLFSKGHMAAEIDREQADSDEPPLREMTEKAIEILSRNPNGFFLMVEGSQIDWACHAMDPAHLLSDMLAYDKAVQSALEFAEKDGNTLVLALSDHNTGGFSIGNMATSRTYTQIPATGLLEPFRRMKVSSAALWKMIGQDESPRRVASVVKEGWGMEITLEDARDILRLANDYKQRPFLPHYAFGEILCGRYTSVGWTSHGHTGGDVPLYAYGPGSPSGTLDGPAIGRICAEALGLSLDRLNRRLFVDVDSVFERSEISLDRTDKENPVLKIEHNGRTGLLPVNKNLLLTDNKVEILEGLVIHIPDTGKSYIPLQAVLRIKSRGDDLPSIRN